MNWSLLSVFATTFVGSAGFFAARWVINLIALMAGNE